jgi:uncharacterized repeat protein (TIGR01451 family)
MTTTMKKTLLVSLAVFLAIVGTVAVVYFVRKPPKVVVTPTPKPVAASPVASATTAPVFVVDQISACTKTFTVACAASPSPSSSVIPSPSPSPSASAPVYVSPSPSTPASANLDCVSKKIFSDDSRNRAGFYYMESEIRDASTVQNGQVVVYNITTKNTGGNSVPDTTVTDTLSSNLTYLDGDSGCTYAAATRVVTCLIGTLAASSEAQRSFRTTVSASGTTSISNTAEVTSTNGQRDSCSVRVDGAGKITVAASPVPTELPVAGVFEVTTGTLGIGLLLLLLGGLGLLLI